MRSEHRLTIAARIIRSSMPVEFTIQPRVYSLMQTTTAVNGTMVDAVYIRTYPRPVSENRISSLRFEDIFGLMGRSSGVRMVDNQHYVSVALLSKDEIDLCHSISVLTIAYIGDLGMPIEKPYKVSYSRLTGCIAPYKSVSRVQSGMSGSYLGRRRLGGRLDLLSGCNFVPKINGITTGLMSFTRDVGPSFCPERLPSRLDHSMMGKRMCPATSCLDHLDNPCAVPTRFVHVQVRN